MPALPIHRSPEHGTGPGADPGSDHGEGQLANRSRAQVGEEGRQTWTVKNGAASPTSRPPPGCALWRERPCPRPPSWKPAATTLLWELRD